MGADEHGSLSFTQMIYMKRFGTAVCKTQEQADLNPYSPSGQLGIFAVFLSSDRTLNNDGSHCEGPFHKLFESTSGLRKAYEFTPSSGRNDISDLRGFIRDGAVVSIGSGDKDDLYGRFARAIQMYNSAENTGFSYPYMIKHYRLDKTSKKNNWAAAIPVCHSCRYSLEIREDTFGVLRDYIWEGGENSDFTTNDEGQQIPHPNAGEEWCFVFGEKEWRNPDSHPVTGNVMGFEGYRDQAEQQTSRRVSCP